MHQQQRMDFLSGESSPFVPPPSRRVCVGDWGDFLELVVGPARCSALLLKIAAGGRRKSGSDGAEQLPFCRVMRAALKKTCCLLELPLATPVAVSARSERE